MQAKHWGDKPYHSLDYALKQQYGEKIYKIALDAGMTCPNRDNTLGQGGCIFCSAGGSGDFASPALVSGQLLSIRQQLEQGKSFFRNKKTGNRFIAYFQSYTNTYAPIERLRTLYTESLEEPDVVGISIATRPDCLGEEVIELLAQLKKNYPNKFIWVELGLQSIHEDTARFIRRGYPLSTFDDAVVRLHAVSIPVIVHVILGLPYETKDMMLDTCRYLNTCHIEGIKLQLLHVLFGTDLAKLYEQKSFEILSLEEYIDIVISCLEVLSPDIVIHRVTGDGPKDLLIAPTWSLNKRNVLNTLHQQLRLRDSWQGRNYIEKGRDIHDTRAINTI